MTGSKIPLVGFITDFGLSDSYVGEMKAVFWTHCSHARLIDISHQIPPGNIASASYLLGRAVPAFPEGSIFLAVVDPGVGASRQAVIIKNRNKYFVGPDNGVFSRSLDWDLDISVRVCDFSDVKARIKSNTFHGRDLFAPLAAKLACNINFEGLGKNGFLRDTKPPQEATRNGDTLAGEVLHVDRFGNVITNIPFCQSGIIEIGKSCIVSHAETYDYGNEGELFWLRGSDGFIEIALKRGDAAKHLNVSTGDSVIMKVDFEKLSTIDPAE